ncbi:MAG: hypothetical protein F6K48_17630 [Okeania sp. SIO3H1]|uniref:hypothetical protein n=1 Tax=Okeania sp. SIO1I7 TaxID=2607772 RepID=UPI0013CAF690|nr:hypothetical protein [Okeania sp. SIO1I7]NEN90630.1 hypothetical protein [Okeania sp. SIO3H1]NET24982.1 hypothetical protein [Okeania sp. SIO1I7]
MGKRKRRKQGRNQEPNLDKDRSKPTSDKDATNRIPNKKDLRKTISQVIQNRKAELITEFYLQRKFNQSVTLNNFLEQWVNGFENQVKKKEKTAIEYDRKVEKINDDGQPFKHRSK